MSTQLLTYIAVGLSFALYIGIAIWSRAGSTKDFYVAGGGVHPIANGMATAADWMSAASFISMAGIIAFAGYDGSVYLMGWTGGYVLLALLLAPYLLLGQTFGAAWSDFEAAGPMGAHFIYFPLFPLWAWGPVRGLPWPSMAQCWL